jgi:hypothetical protein
VIGKLIKENKVPAGWVLLSMGWREKVAPRSATDTRKKERSSETIPSETRKPKLINGQQENTGTWK